MSNTDSQIEINNLKKLVYNVVVDNITARTAKTLKNILIAEYDTVKQWSEDKPIVDEYIKKLDSIISNTSTQ